MLRKLTFANALLYAYLVMVLGCVYYLFNYIEGIPFSEKAGESLLFRICWIFLYAALAVHIALYARDLPTLIVRSPALLGLLGLAAISFLANGTQSDALLRFAMYLMTIVFAAWLALCWSVDQVSDALYRIGIGVLILHVLLLPVVGSEIDYDGLHRITLLGTEPYAGAFGHKNLAGAFFSTLAIVAMVRGLSLRGMARMRSFLVALLHLVALAAAGAAGAVVSAVITVVVLAGFYLFATRKRGLTSVYFLCLGFIVLLMLAVPTEDLYEAVGRTSNLTGRAFLWSAWPHFFWQRPFLGYGFGGFFSSVYNAPSTELTRMAPWNTEYASFENSYMEIVLSFGILGGLVFGYIIAKALWNTLRHPFVSSSQFYMMPVALLILTLVRTANDSALLLHNYVACVFVFWAYFGPEVTQTAAARPYRVSRPYAPRSA